MAPLTSKIHDQLSKLKDRFDPNRNNGDTGSMSTAAQPRSLPASNPNPFASHSASPSTTSGISHDYIPTPSPSPPAFTSSNKTYQLGQSGGGSDPSDLPQQSSSASPPTPTKMNKGKHPATASDMDDAELEATRRRQTDEYCDTAPIIPKSAFRPSDFPKMESHPEPLHLVHDGSLKSLSRAIASLKCKNCGTHLLSKEEHLLAAIKDPLLRKEWLQPTLRCHKCGTRAFIGCNHLSTTPASSKAVHVGPRCDSAQLYSQSAAHSARVAWCNDAGRLFLVWALCCGVTYEKSTMDTSDDNAGKSRIASTRATIRRVTRSKSYSQSATSSSAPKHDELQSPTSHHRRRHNRTSNGTGYGGDNRDEYNHHYFASSMSSSMGLSPGATPAGSSSQVHFDSLPLTAAKRSEVYASNKRSSGGHGSDFLWEQYFRTLSALLPSNKKQTSHTFASSTSTDQPSWDSTPPKLIRVLIEKSAVLMKAAELLNSSSMIEVTRRDALYESLLGFLEALGGHYLTAGLLDYEIVRYPYNESLMYTSFHTYRGTDGAQRWKKTDGAAPAKMNSLLSHLKTLGLECSKMQQTAAGVARGVIGVTGIEADDDSLLVLCRRVMDLVDSRQPTTTCESNSAFTVLQGNSFFSPPSIDADGDTQMSGTTSNAPYTRLQAHQERAAKAARKSHEVLSAWHKEHCLTDVPDGVLLDDFSLAKSAKNVENNKSAVQPGRMKRIIGELATLSTSLPEGIYVRHGSSRVDVMKVLIVGPSGTPYENGLFEFDLLCTENYPSVPPMMQFRTTGYGVIRFNPNLYPDGKVCLSLLGTWSGQPWKANESTLLQVLVSIQAMIFTAEPWYNEPGREGIAQRSQSEAYNITIQQHTVEHAILHWLDDRLASDSKVDVTKTYTEREVKAIAEAKKSAEKQAEYDAKLANSLKLATPSGAQAASIFGGPIIASSHSVNQPPYLTTQQQTLSSAMTQDFLNNIQAQGASIIEEQQKMIAAQQVSDMKHHAKSMAQQKASSSFFQTQSTQAGPGVDQMDLDIAAANQLQLLKQHTMDSMKADSQKGDMTKKSQQGSADFSNWQNDYIAEFNWKSSGLVNAKATASGSVSDLTKDGPVSPMPPLAGSTEWYHHQPQNPGSSAQPGASSSSSEPADKTNKAWTAVSPSGAVAEWLDGQSLTPFDELDAEAEVQMMLAQDEMDQLAARAVPARKLAGPHPDDVIWGEVIRKHFEYNAESIVGTVKKWKFPKPSSGHSHRLARMSMVRSAGERDLVGELTAALKRQDFL